MSNTETAPDGAILTVMCIAARVPPPNDEAVDRWLVQNELVGLNAGGVVDLTERGRAWIDMISATPMPVAVAKWGDPRVNHQWVEVAPQAPASGAARPGAAPVPRTVAAPPAGIPPGFILNAWTELPAGQMPPIPGLARDTELEVIFEHGKTDSRGGYPKRFAGQVIYKAMGKGDDVVAFKMLPLVTEMSGPNG